MKSILFCFFKFFEISVYKIVYASVKRVDVIRTDFSKDFDKVVFFKLNLLDFDDGFI